MKPSERARVNQSQPYLEEAVAARELGGGGERDLGGVLARLFSLILWLGETKAEGDLGDCDGTSAERRCALTVAVLVGSS